MTASGSAPDSRDRVGFTSELGCSVRADGDTLVGTGTIVPELCVPEAGVARPSVLLAWADILTGSLANEFTLPRVCMTVDLSVRIVQPVFAGSALIAVGRVLKTGRTLTFGETTFSIAGDSRIVAESLGTFVASPRPQDLGESGTALKASTERRVQPPPAPVAEMLGSRIVAPGVVEADRHDRILNWAQTVQGGAVASLAEEAVLALDDAPVPNELEVRYLSAIRIGPMRATARRIGSWVRVEVVDAGNDNRLAAVAVARGD
jgi:acyl-coenzyme A thioesterase PaaI-like protein